MTTPDEQIYSNISFDHKPNDTEVRIAAGQALIRIGRQLRVREGVTFADGTTTMTVTEVSPDAWDMLTTWAPLV